MNNQAFSKIWVVIILIILIAGGIFVWQYFGAPEETEMSEKEAVKDETADWETYRNEEYGFEVRYPINFFIKEQKITPIPEETIPDVIPDVYIEGYKYERPVNLLYFVEIYSEDSSLREVEMGMEDIGIYVYDNANNLTVNEWIDYINRGVETGLMYEGRHIGGSEPFSILGIEAVKGISGCCLVCLINIWIPKENKIYELSHRGFIDIRGECPDYYYNEKYGCCLKYENIFNQMLSTFRFLE